MSGLEIKTIYNAIPENEEMKSYIDLKDIKITWIEQCKLREHQTWKDVSNLSIINLKFKINNYLK